jgi:hypothetical protein
MDVPVSMGGYMPVLGLPVYSKATFTTRASIAERNRQEVKCALSGAVK